MEPKTEKRGGLSTILIILGALLLLMILGMMAYLCLPYFQPQEEPAAMQITEVPTEAPTEPPTEEPTEAPTEEPTEAPTEPLLPAEFESPYGDLDFQFEGRFLKCLRTETLTGIDVSAHQKEIDWRWVKACGVDYAMIRIGYRGYESGKLVMDSYAEANLAGAAAVGLPVGIYFFSQALNVEEAEEEARFVLDAIADYEIAMPVVFDWEHVDNETARTNNMDPYVATDCAKAFLEIIDEAGYWPMMYFNTRQAHKLFYLDQLMEYDFWLALYSDRMTFPYKVDMWQYTCTGTVPGIFGDVDVNVMFLHE